MNQEPGTLLIVEDSGDDVLLIQRALRTAKIANPAVFLGDGQAAIDYLSGAGEYADRERHPVPVMMLLDLKLPRVNGLEVLRWLRECGGAIRRLPTVMLTSSRQRPDIDRAFELGANSYLVKPVDLEQLVVVVGQVGMYWLLMNERPTLVDPPPAAPTAGADAGPAG